MVKTMEILKALVVFLVLVPLIGASRLEKLEKENGQLKEELAQLKEMFNALQEKVETKVDTIDFVAQMGTKVDVVDFTVQLNDTEELEARVTVLEESVADLEAGFVILTDDMDNVESANLIQDDRINTLEAEILDNDGDIEELVDVTNGLSIQVSSLEEDVTSLDQRVEDLESGDGGGGGGNITDLEIRVENLETLTSQLSDDVSTLEVNDVTQDERISSVEEDVTSLDQRVEDLESGGGGGNVTDYSDSIFMAVLRFDRTSSRDPLVFDNDVINPGGYYSTTTGQYTVPYDGIYQFSVHLTAYTTSSGVYFNLLVDDDLTDSHVDTFSNEIYRSTTILLELAAGQTVHAAMFSGTTGDGANFRTYFSGYLLAPN